MKRSGRAALERVRARRDALVRRRGARRERRRWPWLLLLLALLLMCLLWPDCREDAPLPPPPPAPAVGASGPAAAPPVRELPPAPTARMPRPDYAPEPLDPLPWLASLRTQVAARGPRLAACFVGAERPGSLRWTTSVEPGSGRVSDHELEPMLGTDPLTAEQRACAVAVLEDPPYRLAGAGPATPSRVGIAIEF